MNVLRTSIVCVLMLCFCSVNARQHSITDSLRFVLSKATNDTSRVLLLNELINNVPKDSIERFNNEMMSIINRNAQVKDKQLQQFYRQYFAIGLNNIAFVFTNKGNRDTALLLYRKSLEINRSLGNKLEIATGLTNIGYVYRSTGKMDSAISYYTKALDIAIEIKDVKKEATLLNNIGIINMINGNLIKAQEYFFGVMRLSEQNDLKTININALNSIGGVYSRLKQSDSALSYFRKGLALSLAANEMSGSVTVMNNIGGEYVKLEQYDSALFYHMRALKTAESTGLNPTIAFSLNALALAYLKINKPDTAIILLKRSEDLLVTSKDKVILSNIAVNMGLAYKAKNEMESAIQYLQKGLELAQATGSVKNIIEASQGLYEIYKQQGRAFDALTMHELYKKMADSLYNDNSRNAVIRMQYQNEYEKKAIGDSLRAAQESGLNKLKISQERTQTIAVIIILILVIIVGVFYVRQSRLNQKLKVARLRNHIAGDLHDDVGSTMSTISILSEVAKNSMEQPEKVTSLLNNIGNSSRELLETLDDIVWSVNPKNDALSLMVPRMKQFALELLGSANVKLSFDVPDDLEHILLSMERRRNVYLVFKEALHNIAKYAHATTVNISLKHTSGRLFMIIKDDGAGFEMINAKKGNGLQNMVERAGLLDGTCDINSSPGKGTKVSLSIPLK